MIEHIPTVALSVGLAANAGSVLLLIKRNKELTAQVQAFDSLLSDIQDHLHKTESSLTVLTGDYVAMSKIPSRFELLDEARAQIVHSGKYLWFLLRAVCEPQSRRPRAREYEHFSRAAAQRFQETKLYRRRSSPNERSRNVP